MTAPRPAPRRARPVARALRHVARPLLACLLLAGAYALAQVVLDSEERRRLEADIQRFEQLEEQRRRELAEIEAALGATAAQLQQRIEERNRVSAQLAERRREREAIVGQIADLEAQRRETEGRIAGLEERLGEMRTRVSELLVALYKQRGSPALFALSRSGSFHELRVRNHYVSLLSQQDADVIGELDSLLYALQMERQSLAEQEAALRQAEAELAAAEAELAAAEARLATVVAELEATREGQLALQADLIAEQRRIEASLANLGQSLAAEVERLRAEEARAREEALRAAQDRERQLQAQRAAAAAAAQREAIEAALEPQSSGLVRPIDGARLVTRFAQANNSYIELESPVANAAVRAVGAGVVVATNYLGANLGYLVAVEHGGGMRSIYVNLRPPVVAENQVVAQGELLGYLGGGTLVHNDTLHFFMQRTAGGESTYVDPAPMLGW